MFEIVIIQGRDAGLRISVDTGSEIAIGRDSACTIQLNDPEVSRRHCVLVHERERLEIIDLGSSNGTLVNGQRVERRALSHGDRIQIGSSLLHLARRGEILGRAASEGVLGETPTHSEPLITLPLGEITRGAGGDDQRLREQLRAVIDVSEELASRADVEDLYQPVLDILYELFPQAERGHLLLGDDVERFVCCATRARGGSGEEVPFSRELCRRALEGRELYVYRQASAGQDGDSESMIGLEIRSAMVVPLMFKREVLGLVVLDSTDARGGYSEQDAQLAAAVCRQIAVAIKNTQLIEQAARESQLRLSLSRFVPKAMAEQIVCGKIDVGLGGQRYEAVVLFADLVGFTKRGEALSPEQMVELLNEYFKESVPLIERAGGSIDKFIGDAILAVWGIPREQGPAALAAVRCALELQSRMAVRGWQLAGQQVEPLQAGVGVNFGPVVAGNVGSRQRREFTIIGDTVNTAQRIEAMASGGQVLVSRALLDQLDRPAFGVVMPEIRIRSKRVPLDVCSVRGLEIAAGEWLLHVPVWLGSEEAILIRRHADESLDLVHRPAAALEAAELSSRLPELGRLAWGAIVGSEGESEVLAEGAALRSRVRLTDPKLGGLLGEAMPTCPKSWDEMPRN
ncbi:MAG: FHA domain-containing protein [Acidobacteriota bacterium]|nr:MAG: FHA domain-containing protein [Acidobacteriota bacterium]